MTLNQFVLAFEKIRTADDVATLDYRGQSRATQQGPVP
jgi:hypothetical protein